MVRIGSSKLCGKVKLVPRNLRQMCSRGRQKSMVVKTGYNQKTKHKENSTGINDR